MRRRMKIGKEVIDWARGRKGTDTREETMVGP